MARIAIDARMFGTGATGIGRYLQNLLAALLRLDCRNRYVLLAFPDCPFRPPAKAADRVQMLAVTARWYTLGEQIRMPFALAAAKADLVHFPHFTTSPTRAAGDAACAPRRTAPCSAPLCARPGR
jgi:hypothetical protein